MFHNDSADFYNINGGLQLGLNLDSLNTKVLNKTVTLHLPKFFYGKSEHIVQMVLNNETIFTEFN